MAITQEPILSRVDRLENILRQLEEIRGCSGSPKSSSASTPSRESQLSSSVDFSPRSLQEKHCRPIDRVLMETEVKGTLLDRLGLVEERLLKLESELVADKKGEENSETKAHDKSKKKKKKGLKGLVNKIVKASH